MTTETAIDYEALLYGYYQYKQVTKDAERDYLKTPFRMDADKASDTLKEHMRDEGLDEFRDPEHDGVAALLSSRAGPWDWDIRNAPTDLILWLAHNGYLTVNTGKVEQDMKDAPDMWLNLLMEKKSGDQYKYRHRGDIPTLRLK